MKKLSLAEAEFIAHQLASEIFEAFDEPMPDFNSRYQGRLESCLEQPFQTFNGKDLYGDSVSNKAAVLFYLVIKNHPFENGNKRMAVALMLAFLFKNGLWLKVIPEKLYNVALEIAKSPAEDKDIVIEALQIFFNKNLIKHNRKWF